MPFDTGRTAQRLAIELIKQIKRRSDQVRCFNQSGLGERGG